VDAALSSALRFEPQIGVLWWGPTSKVTSAKALSWSMARICASYADGNAAGSESGRGGLSCESKRRTRELL